MRYWYCHVADLHATPQPGLIVVVFLIRQQSSLSITEVTVLPFWFILVVIVVFRLVVLHKTVLSVDFTQNSSFHLNDDF